MTSVTLYRKYRPQTFGDIVNQDHVKSTIQQEIKTGKLPHAFLFHGPRGIGKTTTARILAKVLNCKNRQEVESAGSQAIVPEPCNMCEVCISVGQGKSLNLVEVDAASQTGVDNVRDNIIANAQVAVNSNEYKVFIIDEVHMLSTSSFNALLKTLEEPPPRVIFVLATTEINKIPETIISRCQRFDFNPVSAEELKKYLQEIAHKEEREVEENVITAIVRKSSGHVRDAISLLGQILTLEGIITAEKASFILPVTDFEYILNFFELLANNRTKELMILIDNLQKQGLRPRNYVKDLIESAHKLMLMAVGSHPDVFVGESSELDLKRIEAVAGCFSVEKLLKIIDVLIKRYQLLKDLEQGWLPLELGVVEMGLIVTQEQKSVQVVGNNPVKKMMTRQVEKRNLEEKKKPEAESVKTETPKIIAEKNDLASATFAEVEPVWKEVMKGISDNHRSLFIVLRTGELRESEDGVELAFRFLMHHDHVKASLHKLVEETKKYLPNKKIQFKLRVDENMDYSAGGDVEEPKALEKEALVEELSQFAEAFGGTVMD